MSLVNATITNLDTGDELTVLFNPAEYRLDKATYWEPHRAPGLDAPEIEFTLGGSETLEMELHFDSWEDADGGADVRRWTDRLRGLTLVQSDLGRPPICLFSWGGVTFKGILERLSQRFTMFGDSGVPVRAVCFVRFKQFDQGASAASGGGASERRLAMTRSGESLTQMANRELGDPDAWRSIAEANDIDDPLDVPAGKILVLPKDRR